DDAGAARLGERSADALAALVELVREKLSLDGPVVLAGGQLLHQPRLEAEVRRSLGAAIRLDEPPVAGAVRLAALIPPSGSSASRPGTRAIQPLRHLGARGAAL